MNIHWTYEVRCEQCDWSTQYTNAKTWEKEAAAKHCREFNHRVVATSVKTYVPDEDAKPKPVRPTSRDRFFAWCPTCNKFVGIGAGAFFKAAVASHVKRTKHHIEIAGNPGFRLG